MSSQRVIVITQALRSGDVARAMIWDLWRQLSIIIFRRRRTWIYKCSNCVSINCFARARTKSGCVCVCVLWVCAVEDHRRSSKMGFDAKNVYYIYVSWWHFHLCSASSERWPQGCAFAAMVLYMMERSICVVICAYNVRKWQSAADNCLPML